MGTDIHLTLEAKRNDKWIFIASDTSNYINGKFTYLYSIIPSDYIDILSSRNYTFFGILSGVRGSLKPIQINRGYPPDMSEFSRWYHENPDHNEGYVLLSELLNYDWNQKYVNSSLKNEASKLYNAIQFLKNLNEEEIRLIFYFDS